MKMLRKFGLLLGMAFLFVLLSPALAYGLHQAKKDERRKAARA